MDSKPKRRADDECPYPSYCQDHGRNMAKLNTHEGYWKVVFMGAGTFFALLMAFGVWQVNQTIVLRELISSLDKKISSYSYAAVERHARNEQRFQSLERDMSLIIRKEYRHDEPQSPSQDAR